VKTINGPSESTDLISQNLKYNSLSGETVPDSPAKSTDLIFQNLKYISLSGETVQYCTFKESIDLGRKDVFGRKCFYRFLMKIHIGRPGESTCYWPCLVRLSTVTLSGCRSMKTTCRPSSNVIFFRATPPRGLLLLCCLWDVPKECGPLCHRHDVTRHSLPLVKLGWGNIQNVTVVTCVTT
jgi:hypothetical protein